MAFPPAHLLVGAGVAGVVRSAAPPLPRRRAWILAASLAVVPDLDLVLGLALGRGAEYHGTFTHSIAATLLVGLAVGVLGGRRWGVLAGAGYGSHLLVDLLDDRGRTNVLLGWPFTLERPFAIARVFPPVPFGRAGGLRESVLALPRPEAMLALAEQTLIGALFFFALLAVARAIRVARRPRRARRTVL
ncbi:MAG TPA: metal-dependent hydrolase [Longimicrobiaceae bacterium]|nr:metal-dependent hydrolase [Longimicrobiaceae bacterium]